MAVRVYRVARAVAVFVMIAGTGQAADLPRGATMLDTISPTVPRGFAADLPRSPLVDLVMNGGLRFSTPGEAQRHCPKDDVVKVAGFSTAYRPADAPGAGVFMCKAAALQEGDLPR